jgi:hypothetical protein
MTDRRGERAKERAVPLRLPRAASLPDGGERSDGVVP